MITAEKLTFGFSSTLLFQNISFNLPENCHCAMIGSNGTGKTTLMNLIRDPEHYIFDGKIRLDNGKEKKVIPPYPASSSVPRKAGIRIASVKTRKMKSV